MNKPVNPRAFRSKSSQKHPPIGEFHFCDLLKTAIVPAKSGNHAAYVTISKRVMDSRVRGNDKFLRFRERPLWSRGFTLVEIMVVVVIIGIALSIAVSNLFVSSEERVRQEAERTLSLVEKTRDQAVFSGYPIAMRLTSSGIEFLERDPNSVEPAWRAAGSDSLRTRAWRDGVRVELSTQAGGGPAPSATAGNREQVVTFLPTGVGAPFSLRVFSDDYQRFIDGDALGNVSFRR